MDVYNMLPLESEHITNIAYDTVILGFTGKELKILILEYQNSGQFALPGGFIRRDEDLYDAVKRGVRERTGLEKIHLEQFHTFGKKDRDSAYPFKKIAAGKGYSISSDHWVLDRFITIGYYALINYNQVQPTPDNFSDSINWYDINKLPTLMIDHEEIVEKALESIRNDLGKKPIGENLLPEKFTMKELQKVYETILNKEFRRTTFQRKMLGMDILKRHEVYRSGQQGSVPL